MGYISTSYNNYDAVLTISNYINEYLFLPDENWSEYWYIQRLCSRWAAYRLMDDILADSSSTPRNTIKSFISRMDDLSCMTEKTENIEMFRFAKNAAEEILSIFF